MTVLVKTSSNLLSRAKLLAMTSDPTEDSVCAVVVVMYGVCKFVRLLKSLVVTSYKHQINPIIGINSVSNN
jgi:hypothetical protein